LTTEAHQAEPAAVQLAAFVTRLRYEDLPKEIVSAAKALILDQLACELIGSTMPWITPALNLVNLYKGVRGESTVVNSGQKFLAAETAFINATYGQACELDDSAYGSSGHAGTAAVPVALAMGEREHADGREFVTSVVAGYEVMYRLMSSVAPHNIMRGFQSQGIGGPFAGAAIAGRMIGLTQEQMVHALAIAGSHSCGPIEYSRSGGDVKRIHAGIAARAGVHSALLAADGLTGPPTIIDGERGFCRIFSDKWDMSKICRNLGEVFSTANVAFKLYPTAHNNHTPAAAVEHLVSEHQIKPEQVASVRVGVAQKVLHHGAGIRQPQDVLGAQFSVAFSLALALTGRGARDLYNYMNSDLWSEPQMVGLMNRVDCYADPESVGENMNRSTVRIDLKDGRSFTTVEIYPKGSPKNPASKGDLTNKMRTLASAVLNPPGIDALIAAVENIESLNDVGDIAKLLVRKS
jgi:2-methylcitrate dehydratase PrpD